MLYSPGHVLPIHSIFTASYIPGLPMNDKPIRLDRLARMDPDVVSQVHDRYFDELFRYARYRVSSPDVAEDIVSEVFIRLLEAVRKGKSPNRNLRGWLLSTCSHTVNDHFRKIYQRTSEPLADTLASDDPGPAKTIDSRELESELQAALALLTPDQQHVVTLRFGAGYSIEETAALMGKRVNAIKSLQFRAIGALRRHLGSDRI
jgi:RNA polymerase sigma-70 factor (ECF subfamily)